MPPLVLETLEQIKAQQSGESLLSNSPASFLRPEEHHDGEYRQVLYGQDLQNGVVGFGKTLEGAYREFDKNWYAHTGPLAFMGTSTPTDEENTEGGSPDQSSEQDSADWWKREDD